MLKTDSLILELVNKHIAEIDKQIDELKDQLIALNAIRCDYIGEYEEIERSMHRHINVDELKEIAEQRGKLNAVKDFKEVTGMSLMDAKCAVEAIAERNHWQFGQNGQPVVGA